MSKTAKDAVSFEAPETRHDDYYRKFGNSSWQLKPDAVIKNMLRLVSTGTVLDLAVGTGRNALAFASAGMQVTGIDISAEAIRKFISRADELGLSINGVCSDITKYRIEGNYDIVLCNYGLNYLSKEEALRVVDDMKRHTKIGGLNMISGFTPSDTSGFPWAFEKHELELLYNDWNVLKCRAMLRIYNRGMKQEHAHSEVYMMARK